MPSQNLSLFRSALPSYQVTNIIPVSFGIHHQPCPFNRSNQWLNGTKSPKTQNKDDPHAQQTSYVKWRFWLITWYCRDVIPFSFKGTASERRGWMHKQAWASHSALQWVGFLLNFVNLVFPHNGTVEAFLGTINFAYPPPSSKWHGKFRTVYCVVILSLGFRSESWGHHVTVHGLRSINYSEY